MIKENRQFLILLLILFSVGLFLQWCLFERIKDELITNNATIIGSILKQNPELEQEIIETLVTEEKVENREILKKYGLDNLESLEYLESITNFKKVFFGIYIIFFLILSSILFAYFKKIQKRRHEEIQKIDKYLFSLLSDNISVNLKDFQSGELETLQNDLMKVTSKLRNSLDSSIKDKKELSKTMADISHQLKTPLTSLFVINEALNYSDINEQKRKEFLMKQSEILNHMQSLISNLLKVSQIESGMIELKKEKLNIKELINNIYNQLEIIFISKNISLNIQIKEEHNIIGDEYWIGEAILNILKNACEHSYENSIITIISNDTPMYTELIIKDTGEGIDEKDLPHIFERFYKSSKNKDSVGIGLNLSKSILDRTNATIRVRSKKEKYTEFIIHFYKGVV